MNPAVSAHIDALLDRPVTLYLRGRSHRRGRIESVIWGDFEPLAIEFRTGTTESEEVDTHLIPWHAVDDVVLHPKPTD